MLLKTGEQIENDLFRIFETVELDYEEVEKKVKIDAEIIDSIISGNEFSYIKEWLKLIKFVTKEIEYIECSDTILQIQEDIFLYGSKQKKRNLELFWHYQKYSCYLNFRTVLYKQKEPIKALYMMHY